MMKRLLVLALPVALVACAGTGTDTRTHTLGEESLAGAFVQAPVNVAAYLMAPGPRFFIGSPYRVENVQHNPAENLTYNEVGIAGIIPFDLNGAQTTNGEVFNADQMLAAHKTLPLPSIARVTNLENGQSVVVRINNRGPFVNTRIIDVSPAAARAIGMTGNTRVQVQIMAEESILVRDATLRASGIAPTPAPAQEFGLPPEQPTPVAGGTGPFAVQLGAFFSEDSARNLANRVQHIGAAHVVSENQMFKVRISNLDAGTARSTIDTLRRNEGMSPGLLRDGRWVNADSI